ncbi:hypothetical protein D3C87_777550 [compost metagenome]
MDHPFETLKRYSFTTSNIPVGSWRSYSNGGDLNFDAPYQRGLVWSLEQKVRLIDSLWTGLGIPAVYVREHEITSDNAWMEIVDGKQRVSAILEYFNDGFPYRGYRFSELPLAVQRRFASIGVGIVRVHDVTDAEVEEIYDRINFCGVPHKPEDRRKETT